MLFLDQIIEFRGKPKRICCDNGLEYISHKLANWAAENDIELSFIQPGNPQQNALLRALIGRFDMTDSVIIFIGILKSC